MLKDINLWYLAGSLAAIYLLVRAMENDVSGWNMAWAFASYAVLKVILIGDLGGYVSKSCRESQVSTREELIDE